MNPGLWVLGIVGYLFFQFVFGISLWGFACIAVFADLAHCAVVRHERREQSQ